MSLCNLVKYQNFIASPQLRICRKKNQSKETSFYICHKASLSVEAAVVIPFVSAFLVTILYFFPILYVQLRVEEALIYAGRKTAVESSVVEEEALQMASAKAFLMWELREDEIVSKYVQGGALGVSILGSQFEDSHIILHAIYRVKFPVRMFGVDGITLWNQNRFQKWVGDAPTSSIEGDAWVYVTPNGEVYHRLETCKALVVRVKRAFFWTMETVRGENGQKYYACSRCVEKITDETVVYYTDYGELYHEQLNCGYIKRTVDKKKLSAVADRRPCSICSGGN